MPIEIIGQGAYGMVAKAVSKKTGRFVAIKRITDFDEWEYTLVQALREI